MNVDKDLLKNSILYLHKVSDAMPNSFPSAKSYYSSKSRILELRSNMYLPSKMTKSLIRCPRCCLRFTDYPSTVILKPKKKLSRYPKKVLNKAKRGAVLTSPQLKCYEGLKNVDGHIISRICQKCNNVTNQVVKFQQKPAKPKNVTSANSKVQGKTNQAVKYQQKPAKYKNPIPSNSKVQGKKKKKNKKDKFCGLAQDAVIDSCIKKQEQATPIKYNVIATLESLKEEPKKLHDRRRKKKVLKIKSIKEKTIEKKVNKAERKVKTKLSKLLNNSGKSKAVNKLKNFLEGL